jgi:hypothetical protein
MASMSSRANPAQPPGLAKLRPERVMLVWLAGELYGLPTSQIERLLPMVAITALDGLPRGVVGMVNIAGQLHATVDPRMLLGLRLSEPHPNQLLALVRPQPDQAQRYLLWLDGAAELARPQSELVQVAPEGSLTPWMLIDDGISVPVLNLEGLDPGELGFEQTQDGSSANTRSFVSTNAIINPDNALVESDTDNALVDSNTDPAGAD